MEYNINLEKNPWKKVQEEQAMIVMISRAQHGNSECRAAKDTALQKLKDWEAFKVVKDKGQFRINSTWVLWKKQKPDQEKEV